MDSLSFYLRSAYMSWTVFIIAFLLSIFCPLFQARSYQDALPLPLKIFGGMDVLSRNGIAVNLPKNELISALSVLPTTELKSIRASLFNSAKLQKLTPETSILVNRKDTASKPISTKLCEDIASLSVCLRHRSEVPRVLLRNGKRNRSTFEASQSSSSAMHEEEMEGPAQFRISRLSSIDVI